MKILSWAKIYWLRISIVAGLVIPIIIHYVHHSIPHEGHEHAFQIIRVGGLTLALGIIITYSKVAFEAILQKPPLTSAQGLVVGIWLTYVGILGHVANNVLSQFAAYPPDLVHSFFGAATLLLALVGGLVTFISSYTMVGKKIIALGWWTMGVAIGLSIFGIFLVPSDWWNHLDPNRECHCKSIMDMAIPRVPEVKPWDDILTDHSDRFGKRLEHQYPKLWE
jgi:hypothetical protein